MLHKVEAPTGEPQSSESMLAERDDVVAKALVVATEQQLEKTPVRLPWTLQTPPPTCFTINNALGAEECKRLIELSEASGYEAALVNVGGGRQIKMDDVRRSSRCIIDSEAAAELLWERIRHLVPQEVVPGVSKRWRAVGLNERLRFLRYGPGDYFAPHCDGSFKYTEQGPRRGQTSYMTVMLYLNELEAEAGGETNFLNPRDEDEVVRVRPQSGMALIFDHRLLHEGARLTTGVKYAVRTDIMFEQVVELEGDQLCR